MRTSTIGSTLSDLKRRAGLSLNAIAKRAGYSGPSSVQAYFHPEYDPPALDVGVADKLATALEGLGHPPISADEVFALVRVGGTRMKLVGRQDGLATWEVHADVNVYETKHAGRRTWNINGLQRPVECMNVNLSRRVRSLPAQPGLGPNRGAFAIYAAGDAMNPRFRDGEPVFIDPTRSAARGEDVLILLAEEGVEGGFSNAFLATLIARGERELLVRQYKFAHAARVPISAVESMLRIIPWAEVCGA